MKTYTLLLALICFTSIISSQEGPVNLSLQPDTIAIELTDNNVILLTAILNDQDSLKLMFHTAANDMTVTTTAAQQCHSINWEESHEVYSWGGKSQSRFSKSNELSIGALNWSNIPIWENEQSGRGSDGKFGPHLFSDRAIEIDFEKGLMILHQEEPDVIQTMSQVQLNYDNGFMFIPASLLIDSLQLDHKFLIHTGYSKSLLLDDQFVQSNSLSEQLELSDESQLTDSFGNVLKTKSALLPRLQIGGFSFNHIEVSFFEGAINRQKMSVLGTDVLKQFHVVIAADRQSIYLQTNSYYKT